MSKMNHFFHYEDSPFASQQNISDRSPHVEVLWEFGPKHSKRSAVKRRAPFSKWMSCFGIEITMDYLIVEDYNHTSLKEKISDWNFFRHWKQTMLFLGKPLFEKRSVFGGIALIAFDPPPAPSNGHSILVHIFSCPGQLNQWYFHSLIQSDGDFWF